MPTNAYTTETHALQELAKLGWKQSTSVLLRKPNQLESQKSYAPEEIKQFVDTIDHETRLALGFGTLSSSPEGFRKITLDEKGAGFVFGAENIPFQSEKAPQAVTR